MERIKIYAFVFLVCCTFYAPAQVPYVLVLGNSQDGGFPQAGCAKKCCKQAWSNTHKKRAVASLAIIDPATHQSWMIDATPDFGSQIQMIREALHDSLHLPSGIFLTHAHIGHYTGLMNLGREVMGAKEIPVYAMPRMLTFLKENGPWDQLVKLNQISLQPLTANQEIVLNDHIHIHSILVPHRDEYSETVGYSVQYASKNLLYIPDIDKWEVWLPGNTGHRLDSVFTSYDHVLIDGTFYSGEEIGNRDIKEIPHPFMEETIKLLGDRKQSATSLYFIHLNHTNPLQVDSGKKLSLQKMGYRIAEQGSRL